MGKQVENNDIASDGVVSPPGTSNNSMQNIDITPSLVTDFLDAGEALYLSGADVSLVEEVIEDMCYAAGAARCDVFAISPLIALSVKTASGKTFAEDRRITDEPSTDFEKQQEILSICRNFQRQCNGEDDTPNKEDDSAGESQSTVRRMKDIFKKHTARKTGNVKSDDSAFNNENEGSVPQRTVQKALSPARQLRKEIEEATEKPFPKRALYIGGFLSTSCYAVFFGSSWLAAALAGIFGVLVCLMIQFVKPHVTNNNVFAFLATFISGLGIALVGKYIFSSIDSGMVILGTIMILVPGMLLTNSVRDLISGNVMTGILGTASSIVTTSVLAVGYICAFLIISPEAFSMPSSEGAVSLQIASAFFASTGYALFYNARFKQIVFLAIGGTITWVIYLTFSSYLDGNPFTPTFIASVFAALWSYTMGKVFNTSYSMFYYTTATTLVPGRTLYFTMAAASSGKWEMFFEYGLSTLSAIVAIAVGLAAVWAVIGAYQKIMQPKIISAEKAVRKTMRRNSKHYRNIRRDDILEHNGKAKAISGNDPSLGRFDKTT